MGPPSLCGPPVCLLVVHGCEVKAFQRISAQGTPLAGEALRAPNQRSAGLTRSGGSPLKIH